ncbi:MAG TPA: TlpA family protein disulfide reductase [Planctomycetaceae bacterium]|nr:TlpA family protein disulfide reductase [Planctomycetaceae bacterium]
MEVNRFSHRITFPILFSLLCWPGCGANTAPEPKADDDRTAAVSSTNSATQPDPSELLDEVIRRYRRCEAYSDAGQVTLKYRTNGRQFVDSAPYQVAFQRQRRLFANVYQTTIDADGTRFRSRITSPDVPELNQQFLDRGTPEEITWAELTEDSVLRHSIERGLGRFPIVLELLFAPQPLSSFADQQLFPRRLLDNQKIDGHGCYGLEIETPDGPFVLWVDTVTRIVRRVQFPVWDIAAKMAAESGAEEIQVTAELHQAQFEWDAGQSLESLEKRDGDRLVSQFVLPPEPLPTDLLGQRIPPFALRSLDGKEIDSARWEGQLVVLHWFVDHPACEASLQLFDKTARQYTDNQNVVFFAVCAVSSDVSSAEIEQLLQTWNVDTPILRDSDAVGRDVFHIAALPAIMGLGADGRLQIYELTYIPRLDELLSSGVEQLLDGHDLAKEVLARFDEARNSYLRSLENRGQDPGE